MIRAGDYFKQIRNPCDEDSTTVRVPIRPQAARTDNNEEQKSQKDQHMTSFFHFLYRSAAQTGKFSRSEEACQSILLCFLLRLAYQRRTSIFKILAQLQEDNEAT